MGVVLDTEPPASDARSRLELFAYGPGVHLIHGRGTALVIDPLPPQPRPARPSRLALFLSGDGRRTTLAEGEVGVTDTLRPYAWRPHGQVDHFTLVVDRAATGLSEEDLWRAGDRIRLSPLYGLLSAQFRLLCERPPSLAPAAMAALGGSLAQLAEATLLTALGVPRPRQSLESTLFLRMTAYADLHLHDASLGPAQIAAAHFVSVRHLYKVWDQATGQSPARWIMERRLDRAARLLAHAPRDVQISWVAHQCGFTNMSHFSRRFRAAHGLTPREWALAGGSDRMPPLGPGHRTLARAVDDRG